MQALVTQRRCDICIKAWPFCRPPACLWPCAWPFFKPHILPGFVSSTWLAQGHGIGFISSHPFGWAWAAGLANTFHKSSLTALCFLFHGCKNEPLLPCCLPKILACMSRKSCDSGICTSELDGMPNEIWVPAGTRLLILAPLWLEGLWSSASTISSVVWTSSSAVALASERVAIPSLPGNAWLSSKPLLAA